MEKAIKQRFWCETFFKVHVWYFCSVFQGDFSWSGSVAWRPVFSPFSCILRKVDCTHYILYIVRLIWKAILERGRGRDTFQLLVNSPVDCKLGLGQVEARSLHSIAASTVSNRVQSSWDVTHCVLKGSGRELVPKEQPGQSRGMLGWQA